MTAQRLRQAAVKVRATAQEALWTYSDDHPKAGQRVPWEAEDWGCDPGDQAHISLWSPTVALAVADWLDLAGSDVWAWGPLCVCGGSCDVCDDNDWEHHARQALALADLILGAS